MSDEIVYRLPVLKLDDLSDDLVRHMTEKDMNILIYCAGRECNAAAVLDEFHLQQRWYRLHSGGPSAQA